MLHELTKEECAAFAEIGLNAYLIARGGSDDAASDLTDFLADLFHYAAREKLNITQCVENATMHYEAE